MEPIVRKHKIQTLRAELGLRLNEFSSLGQECETESLADAVKSEIAWRQNKLLKEGHLLQLAIDMLERQEKEGNAGETGTISSAALRNYVSAAIRLPGAASPLSKR
jgi:hypothetical protein